MKQAVAVRTETNQPATGSTKMLHVGTGITPNIQNLPAKQQKKVLIDFFLKAQKQIADLDAELTKEYKELKKINSEIKASNLMKKLKARKTAYRNMVAQKDEMLSRYTGAKQLAEELGVDADTSKIKMIEG